MKIGLEKIVVVQPNLGCRKAIRFTVCKKGFIVIYGKLHTGIIPKHYASLFKVTMNPTELKEVNNFLWKTEEDLEQFKRKE